MHTFTFGEVIFMVFLLFLIGFVIGSITSNQYHEKEAIESGVAEWVIDSTTGKTKFQYMKVR